MHLSKKGDLGEIYSSTVVENNHNLFSSFDQDEKKLLNEWWVLRKLQTYEGEHDPMSSEIIPESFGSRASFLLLITESKAVRGTNIECLLYQMLVDAISFCAPSDLFKSWCSYRFTGEETKVQRC